MSGYTWQLIDWFKANQGRSTTRLAINSNLGFDETRLSEFVEAIQTLPHVEVYTSCEATWAQAEYIRDGLNYHHWYDNVQALIESGTIKALHVMCTINALCLDSLNKFLDHLVALKALYGRSAVSFTLNILRFPSFQSPLVLPTDIKAEYRDQLLAWYNQNQNNEFLHEHELRHVQRLIDYLENVHTPHSEAFDMPRLRNDFRQFYSQYDQRRGKDFVKAFPRLKDWYESIQI
jgi:hypothetical protein